MTTRGTILITDCDHPSIDVERDILSAAGWTVTLARCQTAADVVAAGEDATALIVQYAPITGGVLRLFVGVRHRYRKVRRPSRAFRAWQAPWPGNNVAASRLSPGESRG